MAVSKAQQKAVAKYMKNNYDELKIRVPKGEKDKIKAHAESKGESVNGFVKRAIDERMERDNSGITAETTEQSNAMLSPDTLKTAQRVIEITGEPIIQFIERAVQTQSERDKLSLQMGINPATGKKLTKA